MLALIHLSFNSIYLQMVKTIEDGKYPFVMCNFAPPDMVGHTGKYDAAVIACAATGMSCVPSHSSLAVFGPLYPSPNS